MELIEDVQVDSAPQIIPADPTSSTTPQTPPDKAER